MGRKHDVRNVLISLRSDLPGLDRLTETPSLTNSAQQDDFDASAMFDRIVLDLLIERGFLEWRELDESPLFKDFKCTYRARTGKAYDGIGTDSTFDRFVRGFERRLLAPALQKAGLKLKGGWHKLNFYVDEKKIVRIDANSSTSEVQNRTRVPLLKESPQLEPHSPTSVEIANLQGEWESQIDWNGKYAKVLFGSSSVRAPNSKGDFHVYHDPAKKIWRGLSFWQLRDGEKVYASLVVKLIHFNVELNEIKFDLATAHRFKSADFDYGPFVHYRMHLRYNYKTRSWKGNMLVVSDDNCRRVGSVLLWRT